MLDEAQEGFDEGTDCESLRNFACGCLHAEPVY